MCVDSPVGQMVKTPPSQGGVMSSILVRVIYWDIAKLVRHRILVPGCLGSSPNIPIIRKAVALELQLFCTQKRIPAGILSIYIPALMIFFSAIFFLSASIAV